MNKKCRHLQSSLITSLVLFLLVVPTTAWSLDERTGIYITGLYLNANEEVDSEEEDRGSLGIKIGKIMSDAYSLEAHGSVVNSSDTDDGIFTLGGFVRFDSGGKNYNFYGLAGLSVIRNYSESLSDITESSFSYGLGVDVYGSPNLAITVEYVNMIDTELDGGEDLNYQTMGIGLTYQFTRDKYSAIKRKLGFRSIRD